MGAEASKSGNFGDRLLGLYQQFADLGELDALDLLQDRSGERVLALVALREEIVILLVGEVGVNRNRAVEENLELSRAGIEVRRGSEHDHVRTPRSRPFGLALDNASVLAKPLILLGFIEVLNGRTDEI